jgi:hypothetical protein
LKASFPVASSFLAHDPSTNAICMVDPVKGGPIPMGRASSL